MIDTANSRLRTLYPTKHVDITPADIEAVYKRNVLSVDSDAKTSKGVKLGYLTGILYLSPSNYFTEQNLCPYASESCRSACLFSAGRGKFYSVTKARVVKTLAYLSDPDRFMRTIVKSIEKLKKQARKAGLFPAVRLNGTSDIDWSKHNLKDDLEHITIFEYFRDVQFYDYTKDPTKAKRNQYDNYHITFSDSGANSRMISLQPAATNIATVFLGKLPETWNGRPVINGDESDLRFLDPTGVVVGLTAKGSAKTNYANSFVKDVRGCQSCNRLGYQCRDCQKLDEARMVHHGY